MSDNTQKESSGALGAMPATSSSAYAVRGAIWRSFDHFASLATRGAGSPLAFVAAVMAVAVWASLGPMFRYSESWQLVINTGTTIVTFLMVFVIQQGQNKDSVALHLKLNELLAAHRSASNRMIGIEQLDEEDLRALATFYSRLSERAQAFGSRKETHSIDEEGMPISLSAPGTQTGGTASRDRSPDKEAEPKARRPKRLAKHREKARKS